MKWKVTRVVMGIFFAILFGLLSGCGGGGGGEDSTQTTNTRFIDNGNGTVYDSVSKLTWLKNANCFEKQSFYDAIDKSRKLANGQCGLSDGSLPGDWHLPSLSELRVFAEDGYSYSDLNNQGFYNVKGDAAYLTSSSTRGAYNDGDYANVIFMSGNLSSWDIEHVYTVKDGNHSYVWPVRGVVSKFDVLYPDPDDDSVISTGALNHSVSISAENKSGQDGFIWRRVQYDTTSLKYITLSDDFNILKVPAGTFANDFNPTTTINVPANAIRVYVWYNFVNVNKTNLEGTGTEYFRYTVNNSSSVLPACGSANGVAVSTKPTANLCSAGTPTPVTGNGPWNWSCNGSNGGNSVSCQAPLASSGGGLAAPTGFTASDGIYTDKIHFTWNKISNSSVYYTIYSFSTLSNCQSGASFSPDNNYYLRTSSPVNASSWDAYTGSFYDYIPGRMYNFAVQAVDSVGNRSPLSNCDTGYIKQ